MAPTILLKIVSNASAAFPAYLLRKFFQSTFSGDDAEPAMLPSPPKTPVTASAIVEMVIKGAVSIDAITIPCSQNRIQLLSAKDLFSSKTFQMVKLTLGICI